MSVSKLRWARPAAVRVTLFPFQLPTSASHYSNERVLPVVQRELMVSSRRWAPFLLRIASAVFALIALVAMVMFRHAGVVVSSDSGLPIFRLLTEIAFWIVYFGGAMLTADSLATERRDGTLGLLFLTDLKGYDVVLGKVTARFIAGLFAVLAIVPMLAIPMLMGGVSAGEFWRTVAVLLVTLLFSASVGIAISVLFLSSTGVFTASLVAIVMVAWVPLIVGFSFESTSPFWHLLWMLQPSAALRASGDSNFVGSPEQFIVSVMTTVSCTALLLVWSCRRVSTSWQIRQRRGLWLRFDQFSSKVIHGDTVQRRELRNRLLDIHPLLWLHGRMRLMPRILIVYLIVLAALCTVLIWAESFPWNEIGVALVPLLFLQISFVAMVTCEAANYFPRIKRHGGAELLLSTQLSTGDIVEGHLLTLRRLFRAPLIAVSVYALIWLVTALFRTLEPMRLFAALVPLCTMALLISCSHAAALHALNASIRPRLLSDVAGKSLFVVLCLPWLWYWLARRLLSPIPQGPVFRLLLFTAVALVGASVVASIARRRLYRDCRRAIAEDPKSGC